MDMSISSVERRISQGLFCVNFGSVTSPAERERCGDTALLEVPAEVVCHKWVLDVASIHDTESVIYPPIIKLTGVYVVRIVV